MGRIPQGGVISLRSWNHWQCLPTSAYAESYLGKWFLAFGNFLRSLDFMKHFEEKEGWEGKGLFNIFF